MNNDVALQLYGGALFVTLGAIIGLVHIIVLAVASAKKWRILSHIAEAIFIALYGLLFIAISHLLFNGLITYYTIFSTLCGYIAVRLTTKKAIETLIVAKTNMHKSKKNTHINGNDKGEKCQTEKTNITKINLMN